MHGAPNPLPKAAQILEVGREYPSTLSPGVSQVLWDREQSQLSVPTVGRGPPQQALRTWTPAWWALCQGQTQ